VQGNRPRASGLRANGVRAVQEHRAGDATKRGGPAGGYAGVPAVFQRHTRVSRGGSAREQENLEVRGGVDIANQSGSIILSHGPRHPATPIPRRSPEQDHNTSRKLLDSFIEPLRSLYIETSLPWQSRLPPPQVTVRNIPPAIFHPLQSPDKLLRHPRNLVTIEHSHRRSCSPREFTFHPFSSITKATPRFALIH
jgi:hypothetical protein